MSRSRPLAVAWLLLAGPAVAAEAQKPVMLPAERLEPAPSATGGKPTAAEVAKHKAIRDELGNPPSYPTPTVSRPGLSEPAALTPAKARAESSVAKPVPEAPPTVADPAKGPDAGEPSGLPPAAPAGSGDVAPEGPRAFPR